MRSRLDYYLDGFFIGVSITFFLLLLYDFLSRNESQTYSLVVILAVLFVTIVAVLFNALRVRKLEKGEVMGPGPILLIWEEVPENTKMFFLEQLTQEDFDRVCAAHGTHMNVSTETDDTNWLHKFVFEPDTGKPKFEAIFETEGGSEKPIYVDRPCTVVISGFYL